MMWVHGLFALTSVAWIFALYYLHGFELAVLFALGMVVISTYRITLAVR